MDEKQDRELRRLRSSRQWKERDARKALELWENRGGSLLSFSRETGIHYKRLRNWKKRVSRLDGSTGEAFIRFEVPGAMLGSTLDPVMEIVLAGSRTVRVRPGFDRQSLVELIGLLEARS